MSMLAKLKAAFVASVVLLAVGPVGAQEFPGKVVRIVIPFSLGGSNDLSARVLLPHLMEKWKHQVVIEPRVGADSTVGTDHVAKSAPDGHTILYTSTQFAYATRTFAN